MYTRNYYCWIYMFVSRRRTPAARLASRGPPCGPPAACNNTNTDNTNCHTNNNNHDDSNTKYTIIIMIVIVIIPIHIYV